MHSLNTLFRRHFYLGTIISGLMLCVICFFHIRTISADRIESFVQMLGNQLSADRDHIFNLLLLGQEESFAKLLSEYQTTYRLADVRLRSKPCPSCQERPSSIFMRQHGGMIEVYYELDSSQTDISWVRFRARVSTITQRTQLIAFYVAIYLCGLLMYLLCMGSLTQLLQRRFIAPFNDFILRLDSQIANQADDTRPYSKMAPPQGRFRVIEQVEIETRFFALLQQGIQYRKIIAVKEREESLGKLATQVAHDLRSPLSSMQVAVRGLGTLTGTDAMTPQYVQLLQLSATRLSKIADDLLQRHHGAADDPTIFSLHGVLDELVGEYQSRDDTTAVTFVKQYHDRAIEVYGPRTQLQRAIGNIVKNAIEAIHDHGTITFVTRLTDTHTTLSITDTGPGMSSETLAKVLQGGHTTGKTDGHGIGTTVVRETVEAFGGRVEGESIVGRGTTFRLVLPVPTPDQRATAEREALALQELRIPVRAGEPVLVVDDEPSMREQWRVLLAEQDTAVRMCTCYEDVEAQGISAAVAHTAIVDYHFANSVHHGVEVIQLLQQRGITQCILCTAEYWKPSVQSQAKDLGMQLCPKPVPVRIVVERVETRDPADPRISGPTNQRPTAEHASIPVPASLGPLVSESSLLPPDAILIDDDPDIQCVWRLTAQEVGKRLQTYATSEAFLAIAPQVAKTTPIYIDSCLGNGTKGENVAKSLRDHGFTQLYLATGYQPKDFAHVTWVQGIIGKTPPWRG